MAGMRLAIHGLPRPKFLILLLVVATGAWAHLAGEARGTGGATASVPAIPWGILNPLSRDKSIGFRLTEAQLVGVEVRDFGGNALYAQPPSTYPAGSFVVPWNGRDASGRHAPAGLYELRYEFPDRDVHRLLVLGGIP